MTHVLAKLLTLLFWIWYNFNQSWKIFLLPFFFLFFYPALLRKAVAVLKQHLDQTTEASGKSERDSHVSGLLFIFIFWPVVFCWIDWLEISIKKLWPVNHIMNIHVQPTRMHAFETCVPISKHNNVHSLHPFVMYLQHRVSTHNWWSNIFSLKWKGKLSKLRHGKKLKHHNPSINSNSIPLIELKA